MTRDRVGTLALTLCETQLHSRCTAVCTKAKTTHYFVPCIDDVLLLLVNVCEKKVVFVRHLSSGSIDSINYLKKLKRGGILHQAKKKKYMYVK